MAFVTAAGIAAAASTAMAGMAGANALMDTSYRVSVGIEVENWTKFRLTDAIATPYSGQINKPPSEILPGNKGPMAARKSHTVACGSVGTVSWKIETGNSRQDRRLIVMWSMPFNHDHYDNILAVGITKPGRADIEEGHGWYKFMYYDDKADEVKNTFGYKRGNYGTSSREIQYTGIPNLT
ncbi:tereporin-Ca1-like [Amphiura filiformis]|uniref:tereporin-Ca1-like n=1 Tax=Amphiura filiformis TaxID=82378 RepID=UPI003B20E505